MTPTPTAPRDMFLICNAHLDPVWLWEWEEGAAAAISTFRTAADLCEKFDTFIFNHNEVILYRWVEELEPDLFQRIQKLVAQGRWHIMGGWYLQPDCNMPSGESFVRQILLGRRYFWEKFQTAPTTAINFDPFGHTRGLVQILARSGYDSYLFCRPDQLNCALPDGPFYWQGLDGSQVLAVRPWRSYLSALGKAHEKVIGYAQERPLDNPGILLWGVGDHGGGPSLLDVETLNRLIAETKDANICHATPEQYFSAVRERGCNLPVEAKSLNPWGVGCYTSMSQIKLKHRRLENELFATEKMLSSAWAQGRMDYPAEDLSEAMRDLATSEFHDIIPGSSIQPVEDMALRLMDHGLEILSRLKARAFFALAQGQPAAGEGEIPILVYNPHPYPVQAQVECEFQLADQNWSEDFTIAQAFQNGNPLPTQMEQELSNLNLDWRKRVVFQAELAPAQMNRFDCRLERIPTRPRPLQPKENSITFVTDQIEVLINKNTGLIDRYRVNGVDFLKPGAGKMLVITDSPDPWGMTVNRFPDVCGAFKLLSSKKSAWLAGVPARSLAPVRIIEDGDVRTVVEALFGYHQSYLCVRYKLPKQGNELEIEARVHWNEKDRMLKLSLPFAPEPARLAGQVAFGQEDLRTDGSEVVAQKWVMLIAEDQAMSVVNDRTYGMDCQNGELRISLLRSPAYAAHPIYDRPLLPIDRYSPRQDQGERLFHFWLKGGAVDERLQQIDREALAHNEAPVALSFFPSGDGRKPEALAVVNDPVVQVSAMKKAEDANALVIRLSEPTGQARSTLLSLPFTGCSLDVHLQGFEVKSYAFDLTACRFEEINLDEGPYS